MKKYITTAIDIIANIDIKNIIIVLILILILGYFIVQLKKEKTSDIKAIISRMLTFDVIVLLIAIVVFAFIVPNQLFSIFLTMTGFYITYRLLWMQLKQEKINEQNEREKINELLRNIQEAFNVSAINRDLILFQQRGIEDVLVKVYLKEFFNKKNLNADRQELENARYFNYSVPSITTFIVNSSKLKKNNKYSVLIRVSDHGNNFSADKNGLKTININSSIEKEVYGFMRFSFVFPESDNLNIEFEMTDRSGNKSKQIIIIYSDKIEVEKCEIIDFVCDDLPQRTSLDMVSKKINNKNGG